MRVGPALKNIGEKFVKSPLTTAFYAWIKLPSVFLTPRAPEPIFQFSKVWPISRVRLWGIAEKKWSKSQTWISRQYKYLVQLGPAAIIRSECVREGIGP